MVGFPDRASRSRTQRLDIHTAPAFGVASKKGIIVQFIRFSFYFGDCWFGRSLELWWHSPSNYICRQSCMARVGNANSYSLI